VDSAGFTDDPNSPHPFSRLLLEAVITSASFFKTPIMPQATTGPRGPSLFISPTLKYETSARILSEVVHMDTNILFLGQSNQIRTNSQVHQTKANGFVDNIPLE
jgi:hypothetical protein